MNKLRIINSKMSKSFNVAPRIHKWLINNSSKIMMKNKLIISIQPILIILIQITYLMSDIGDIIADLFI